jgi:hypothetical protein
MAGNVTVGRHRLGTPGLVHCVAHRQVAEAVARQRMRWRDALTPAHAVARVRARHSMAGLRRRAVVVAMERAWVPNARPAHAAAVDRAAEPDRAAA